MRLGTKSDELNPNETFFLHFSHFCRPPAAGDELGQTTIGQVPAAPQVQRTEEAAACSHHAGHHIVVLDLQE